MTGSRGLVKIMDFGLAQLAGSSKLTREGTTLGTPTYMSPEQASGEPTDERSDVWGLGVVLYEMVAGRPAFQGEVDQAVVYAILNKEPEPLTAVRTGVPKALELIVDKCLAKKAEERYQHTADLLVDLHGVRRDLEPQPSRATLQAAPARRTSPALIVRLTPLRISLSSTVTCRSVIFKTSVIYYPVIFWWSSSGSMSAGASTYPE